MRHTHTHTHSCSLACVSVCLQAASLPKVSCRGSQVSSAQLSFARWQDSWRRLALASDTKGAPSMTSTPRQPFELNSKRSMLAVEFKACHVCCLRCRQRVFASNVCLHSLKLLMQGFNMSFSFSFTCKIKVRKKHKKQLKANKKSTCLFRF